MSEELKKEKLVKILNPFGMIKNNTVQTGIISVESTSTFLKNDKTISQPFMILYSQRRQNPVVAVNTDLQYIDGRPFRKLFEDFFLRIFGFKVEYMLQDFTKIDGTKWSVNIINGDKILKFYDTKVKLLVLETSEVLKKILNINLTVYSASKMFSNIISNNDKYIIVYSKRQQNPVVGFNLKYSEENKEFFEKTFEEKFNFKPIYIGLNLNINNSWNIYVLNGIEILKKILNINLTVDSATNFLTRERLRNVPYEIVYSNRQCNPVVGFSPYDFSENNNSDAVENLKTNRERFLIENDFF
jgi:hypothetical protein